MIFTQIKYQLILQLKVKLHDPFTLVVSFIIAPLLGILTALIFYSSDELVYNDTYSYFLFFMLVSAIFFGLVGSIFEIIKELPIIKRQRLGNISTFSYFFSKYVVLALFGFIQVLFFILASMSILDAMLEDYIYNFFIMYLLLLNSIAFGLWISSMVTSTFMATNLIPLIIVPQILLGGMVPYESMHKSLYLGLDTSIPIVAKFVPITYAYESTITGHVHINNDENINDSIVGLINSKSGEFLSMDQPLPALFEDIELFTQTWSYDIIILLIYLFLIQTLGFITLKRKLR